MVLSQLKLRKKNITTTFAFHKRNALKSRFFKVNLFKFFNESEIYLGYESGLKLASLKR